MAKKITENSGESRSALLCSGRLETLIQPGKDSVGVGKAPRCRSALLRTGLCLRALDGARSARTHTASPGASLSQSEARRQALP